MTRAPRRSRRRAVATALSAAVAVGVLACSAAPGDERARAPVEPGESEILWDTWGVPHVYAANVEELGYGFGWAQMRLHADAILELYALARGRAAEYWGEDYLASDRLTRTLGIPDRGREAVEAQEEEFGRYVEGFVQGMNAYAREHPDAISERVRAVLPVEPADPFRHGHRSAFAFVAGTGDRRSPVGLDGMPTGTVPGSNTWAIGPSRSASGNAMLLQNPHLPWQVPLMRFTEAQLAGPGIDVYGVTLIGLPAIAIGFNENLGWSHTVNTIDAFDSWRLILADDGYRFDGSVRAFEVGRQTLRVRQDDGAVRVDTLVIRRSVHGPVVRVDDSIAVAVRTPALDRHGALGQWWEMGRARDLETFEAASRRLQIPMFTTSYADRDGHIYYLFGGQVPVRPARGFAEWQGAVAGDTSATLWSEIHPYDDLPKVVDPETGFVQNSNSPPWHATVPSPLDPSDYPAYMAPPGGIGLREARGLEMLLSDENITFDELIEMRYSNRMLLADRVLDELLVAAREHGGTAAEAATVLEAWNRSVDADSRGAVLFFLWAREMCGSDEWSNRCGLETPWSADAPLATPDGLAEPVRAAAVLDAVAANVERQFGALDVAWGDVMRLTPELPGSGAPGDPFGVFHVVGYAPSEGGGAPFRAAFGDTWVAAIEFGSDGPRARAILSYGNASQPGSPHRNDQLPLLSREEMRPAWFTQTEVEANLESRTPIRPAVVAGTR